MRYAFCRFNFLLKGSATATRLQQLRTHLQRYRPVLTESFVEALHSRGVDVDAVRIEPGASPAACSAAGCARRMSMMHSLRRFALPWLT